MNGATDIRAVTGRPHLFEFSDQAWLPAVCRDCLTEIVEYQTADLYAPVARKLAEVLRLTGCDRILDLCSGSGGPLPRLQRRLEREGLHVSILLTDRFPNARAIARLRAESRPDLSYLETPVDARSVPAHLPGLRTLFTSFHHFKPEDARRILRDAVEARAPIAIFEFTERAWANATGMMLAPLAVLTQAGRLKPFRWSRFLLTYLLPIVPFIYWWDGTVSHLRTYTVVELRSLTAGLGPTRGYRWEAGTIEADGQSETLTFLIGYPRQRYGECADVPDRL